MICDQDEEKDMQKELHKLWLHEYKAQDKDIDDFTIVFSYKFKDTNKW